MKVITPERAPNLQEKARRYIKWFREIGIEELPLVGGKTARWQARNFEKNFAFLRR